MNDKGEYVQISIFDILDKQTEQTEKTEQIKKVPYDRCDHCNMPCCSICRYAEEDKDK